MRLVPQTKWLARGWIRLVLARKGLLLEIGDAEFSRITPRLMLAAPMCGNVVRRTSGQPNLRRPRWTAVLRRAET
jgi:hypothetical protein